MNVIWAFINARRISIVLMFQAPFIAKVFHHQMAKLTILLLMYHFQEIRTQQLRQHPHKLFVFLKMAIVQRMHVVMDLPARLFDSCMT